jgi:hypothetical protein
MLTVDDAVAREDVFDVSLTLTLYDVFAESPDMVKLPLLALAFVE